MGFSQFVQLSCMSCNTNYGKCYSSPRVKTATPGPSGFNVNTMPVLLFNEHGLGFSGMHTLGAVLCTHTLNLKSYHDKNTRIS